MDPRGVVISVMAGLLAVVAIIGAYNVISARWNEGEAIDLLNKLRVNVESVYNGQSTYGTNANLVTTLEAFKRIPDGARQAGPPVTIQHPFGKPVTVVGNGGRFMITFHELDDGTCNAIGKAYTDRTRAGSGIIRIQVNTSAPTTVPAQAPRVWSLTQLTNNCDEGAESNFLTFVFG